MGKKHNNVVNVDELSWENFGNGARFESASKSLGDRAGSARLGCSLYRQPPGKQAFPKHHHYNIEEAVYVLEGQGTMIIGDDQVPLEPGDYVALPVGEHLAHAIVNTSDADLVYLCMSTIDFPDVIGYPDSGKIGVVTGWEEGGTPKGHFRGLFKRGDTVPYFTDED